MTDWLLYFKIAQSFQARDFQILSRYMDNKRLNSLFWQNKLSMYFLYYFFSFIDFEIQQLQRHFNLISPSCFNNQILMMQRSSAIVLMLLVIGLFTPAESTFGLLGLKSHLFGNFWNLFSKNWGLGHQRIPKTPQLIPNFNRNLPIPQNNIRTNSDNINIENSNININQVPGFLTDERDIPITYVPSNALPFSTINNYLTNGDFEIERIPQNRRFYVTNNIPSWIVNNGELGLGEYFNINWAPQTQLIHLNSNLGYRNRINLRPGRFQLSFDWAPREGQVYSTSKFQLKFNNKLMKTITPWNDYCHRYSMVVDSIDGLNDVEIVGSGILDNYGASIDNVVLRDYFGH